MDPSKLRMSPMSGPIAKLDGLPDLLLPLPFWGRHRNNQPLPSVNFRVIGSNTIHQLSPYCCGPNPVMSG